MNQRFGGTQLSFDTVIAIAFETAIHDDTE
jgi:hypothetical protein